MQNLGATIIASALSVVVTLLVTFLFNKLVAIPSAIRQQREAARQEQAEMIRERNELVARVEQLESVVNALPSYRQQSLTIQNELRAADSALLATCESIQQGMTAIQTSAQLLQQSVDALRIGQNNTKESLDRLEKREKNALRMKIISEYRLFTNKQKNPEQAWSEMEHHAFFNVVHDYEALGGNDYVHSTVIPAMNELEVVFMDDLVRLEEVMTARQL